MHGICISAFLILDVCFRPFFVGSVLFFQLLFLEECLTTFKMLNEPRTKNRIARQISCLNEWNYLLLPMRSQKRSREYNQQNYWNQKKRYRCYLKNYSKKCKRMQNYHNWNRSYKKVIPLLSALFNQTKKRESFLLSRKNYFLLKRLNRKGQLILNTNDTMKRFHHSYNSRLFFEFKE